MSQSSEGCKGLHQKCNNRGDDLEYGPPLVEDSLSKKERSELGVATWTTFLNRTVTSGELYTMSDWGASRESTLNVKLA